MMTTVLCLHIEAMIYLLEENGDVREPLGHLSWPHPLERPNDHLDIWWLNALQYLLRAPEASEYQYKIVSILDDAMTHKPIYNLL